MKAIELSMVNTSYGKPNNSLPYLFTRAMDVAVSNAPAPSSKNIFIG